MLDESESSRRSATIQVKRNAPNSVWSASLVSLSKDEHARAGKIVNSEAESVLLSDGDKVYLTLKVPANQGDSFAVYRTVKAIEHPVTGEPYGYAVEILGGATIRRRARPLRRPRFRTLPDRSSAGTTSVLARELQCPR